MACGKILKRNKFFCHLFIYLFIFLDDETVLKAMSMFKATDLSHGIENVKVPIADDVSDTEVSNFVVCMFINK